MGDRQRERVNLNRLPKGQTLAKGVTEELVEAQEINVTHSNVNVLHVHFLLYHRLKTDGGSK